MSEKVTLALPSKGAIADPTYNFLRDCGLKIYKPNPRQYVGSIPAIPALGVLFQRVKDVVYKVTDGTAHLGITGYDVVCENPHPDLVVIHPELGYGHCRLVIAVPEAWVDVSSVLDLAEVAHDFREKKGRNIRIATTYAYLARQFLHEHHIHHFTLVKAEGAIEAAPTLGYADLVIDLVQTGTTLRENHLKELADGIIVESQACMIGNRQALKSDAYVLDAARMIAEHIDAAVNGKAYHQITVNIQGRTPADVARKVAAEPATRGLLGPTVAPIYSASADSSADSSWHTVTVTVSNRNLLSAVDYLRSIGGSQVIVSPVNSIFMDHSPTYRQLVELLEQI